MSRDNTALLNPDSLVDWLRQQPPDGEYIWQDPVFCMMGRYLADHDSRWGEFSYSEMPNYDAIAGKKPWTFGAALERAEALKQLPPPAKESDHVIEEVAQAIESPAQREGALVPVS